MSVYATSGTVALGWLALDLMESNARDPFTLPLLAIALICLWVPVFEGDDV